MISPREYVRRTVGPQYLPDRGDVARVGCPFCERWLFVLDLVSTQWACHGCKVRGVGLATLHAKRFGVSFNRAAELIDGMECAIAPAAAATVEPMEKTADGAEAHTDREPEEERAPGQREPNAHADK